MVGLCATQVKCLVLFAPELIGVARFTDADHRFSFAPPANWKRKLEVPAPAVDYAGPKSGKFSVNIAVNVYASAVRPADEAKLVQSIAVRHGTLYSMGATKLDGSPAHSWRTHLLVPGFPKLENHQILCVHGGRVVELTLTAPPASIKKYDLVFDRLIASFHWEDAVSIQRRSPNLRKQQSTEPYAIPSSIERGM